MLKFYKTLDKSQRERGILYVALVVVTGAVHGIIREKTMIQQRPKIVISGSFRRFFDGISTTVKEFEKLGVSVLSPKASKVLNPGDEFAILESDDTRDPKTLEQRHLDAITASDALYIYNEDGYLGDSTKMEFGWALATGKPIFCKEPIDDVTLSVFISDVATPEQVAAKLADMSPLELLNKRSSVAMLQSYIHDMVVRRGFDDESPRDVMLLFVEEVGELAKALRKYTGIKTDDAKKDRYPALEAELGDVFIYLLDLANLLDVSLFDALYNKEQENEKREWS